MDALQSILDLSLGDHLCCMYETEEEHRAVLAPFIRSGLDQNHKVFYVVDSNTAEAVFAFLEQEGVAASDFLASGQLVVAESRDTYTRGGQFDPDSMIALLGKETRRALEEGFSALRVTGEMSWALRGLPGSERLMEYEAKLNQFFPVNRAIGLCQYDMRRFKPETLLDVLATHPIAVVRSMCYDNIYYIPPEEFMGPCRAEAELQGRIRNLEERQQARESLQQSEERARRVADFTNAILDTAGALIIVLDREGTIVRFNRTLEQLTSYTEEEILGHSLWEMLIPVEENDVTRKTFQDLLGGQFPNRLENNLATKEGGAIRVAWTNTCLKDESGEVELIVSIGLDVTESSMAAKARKREFNSLEAYSAAARTSNTASSLGVAPLHQTHPGAFQELAAELGVFMDQAMKQKMYKVKRDVSGKLRSLADRLGALHAGPRDVVQAYVQALQDKTRDAHDQKARAYTDEGRLLLIELMGYLATYYHNRSLGKGDAPKAQRGSQHE